MELFKNISIIIVSYKSKNKVLKLIKKISSKFKIVIIENSEDKSLKEKVKLLKNTKIFFKKNVGYGSAANFARKKINTQFFLLCNPDIENLNDNKIYNFYKIATKLKNNFLCLGPSYEKKIFKYNFKISRVKKISGACMLINTRIFDILNGFDENFFLYFEEDDLCKRGNKKKFYSYKTNEILIKHKSGSSVSNIDEKEKKSLKELTLWHFIWSDFYFHKKHLGKILGIIIFIPTLIRIIFKILLSYFVNDEKMHKKYSIRFDALVHSIKGKKSTKR
jgi:N-acetylglucosaminyl-diphospho-decaprenol L-rhamnosyltransferase